jgi:enoyl-CoA hydratase
LGLGAARHLVLTAQVLDAADGHRLGFVQEIGDEASAHALADRVQSLAPLSVAGSKLGFAAIAHRPDTSAYEDAFRRAWQSEDLAEGRAAFAERRSPRFKGA